MRSQEQKVNLCAYADLGFMQAVVKTDGFIGLVAHRLYLYLNMTE